MPFILNTEEVAESDRREFVRYALGMTIVPIELRWPDNRRGVKARGIITDLGDLTVASGEATALRVDRTARLAREPLEPYVFVNVQHFGPSIVVQHGREAVARPGDLVMYDSTAPYTMLNETGMTGDFFRIPHSALALPHAMIREACAVRLAAGHPLTALTNDYLRRLAAGPGLPTAQGALSRWWWQVLAAVPVRRAGLARRRRWGLLRERCARSARRPSSRCRRMARCT